uniref:Beta-Casp domain-containing protein n=1 Tax=Parascaris univalens TaxID=6257 RepID=A0A915A1Y9_PARUN
MDSMDLNSELLGECPEIANSKLENDKLKYRICILKQVCNVFTVMAETLKKNGSVLMPMCPTGVLYDLLEVITVQLDQQGVAMDTPVYFISPVAESSIAFSNICPEWLSDKKQNMAYFPEEPFTHAYVSYIFITMIAGYPMAYYLFGFLIDCFIRISYW